MNKGSLTNKGISAAQVATLSRHYTSTARARVIVRVDNAVLMRVLLAQ